MDNSICKASMALYFSVTIISMVVYYFPLLLKCAKERRLWTVANFIAYSRYNNMEGSCISVPLIYTLPRARIIYLSISRECMLAGIRSFLTRRSFSLSLSLTLSLSLSLSHALSMTWLICTTFIIHAAINCKHAYQPYRLSTSSISISL